MTASNRKSLKCRKHWSQWEIEASGKLVCPSISSSSSSCTSDQLTPYLPCSTKPENSRSSLLSRCFEWRQWAGIIWMGLVYQVCFKKDMCLGLFVNYRKFYAVAIKRYLCHRSDGQTYLLACRSMNGLVINANSGYFQDDIYDHNCDNTIFTSRQGLFRFIREPFCL